MPEPGLSTPVKPNGVKGQKIGLKKQARPVGRPHELQRVAAERAGSFARPHARRARREGGPQSPCASLPPAPAPVASPAAGGSGRQPRMRIAPRLGDGRRASARGAPLWRHVMSGAIPHKRGCPGAAGGLTAYPMVRRADPRVGRACARATQGARRRPCLPFPRARLVSSLRAAERAAKQIALCALSSPLIPNPPPPAAG